MSGEVRTNPLILLGAGASVPAGVPTAAQMTGEMLSRCDDEIQRSALRAIVGALHMLPSTAAKLTLPDADIESVMRAADILAERGTLEFSPFVGAWNPVVEELERKFLDRLDINGLIAQAMGPATRASRREPISASAAVGVIQSALRTVLTSLAGKISNRPNGQLFRELKHTLSGLLVGLTWIADVERVKYYEPLSRLLQNGRLTIASLNYDNGVELWAASQGLPCETGLAHWLNADELPDVQSGIELLKLHGSIDWWWQSTIGDAGPLGRYVPLLSQMTPEQVSSAIGGRRTYLRHGFGHRLGVLFGGANKLTAEGPYLELLAQFKRRLRSTNRLTTIGYSFRDDHINRYIFEWLRRDDGTTLTVVEKPGFDDQNHPLFVQGLHSPTRIKILPIGAEKGILELAEQP